MPHTHTHTHTQNMHTHHIHSLHRHIEVIITDIVTAVTNYFTILLIAPASGSVAMT